MAVAERPTTAGTRNGLIFAQLALGMIAFGSTTPISKIVTGAMPVFVGSLFRVGLGRWCCSRSCWSAVRP